VRDGRVVGAVVGVGVVAGVALVLLRSKTTSASSASTRSPQHRGPLPLGWFPPLVERWRGEVQERAGDLPIDALLEWIRIESGGDMCSVGKPTEVGIWQLSFPSDAKYGATLEGLRAICEKSRHHDPTDISWLSASELDMEVGAGIHKVAAARDTVRQVFAQTGVKWPESTVDFGSAVKQIHATPGVITELVPKIARRDGPPASWSDLRKRVMAFPVEQMSGLDKNGRPYGLRKLALAPSKHGLKNRLEDTLANAEFVGHAWGATRMPAFSESSRGNYV